MVVKFKVAFTMSAETLFGIIAKFLPVEDLQVEEIAPGVVPLARPSKAARLAAPSRAKRGDAGLTNLEEGVNGLIMRTLADGQPHRYRELKANVAKGGFSASGIGSRLARLREVGAVVRASPGFWRLAEVRKSA
jgi:hypothetical protein